VVYPDLPAVVQITVEPIGFIEVLLAIIIAEVGVDSGFDLLTGFQTDKGMAGEFKFTTAIDVLHEILFHGLPPD
jgi:hypothetical protein